MIRLDIGNTGQHAWTELVSGFRDCNLLQSWAYGDARTGGGWRVERARLLDGERAVGAAQIMIRQLPLVGGGLAWISRGPLWQRTGGEPAGLFLDLVAALKRHYAAAGGFYLRIAPTVESDGWQTPERRLAVAEAGFRITHTPGWASSVVDLTRPEDELRRGLRQKWRNGLNVAERHGVDLEIDAGGTGFDEFLAEYRSFVAARGFSTSVTAGLLRSIQAALPPAEKMVCYRGFHGGAALGSVLMARYGDTAEYLAGTVLEAGRRRNIGQLLLWRALIDLKARKVRKLDLGGMDSELTPKGIFDFKRGLGGVPYRLAPEIEATELGLRARLVRWRVERARGTSDAGPGDAGPGDAGPGGAP